MKKVLIASIVLAMVFSFGLMTETFAFPEDGKVGQPEDHDGTVTRVEFYEDHSQAPEGWYLIMPYRGDFGGTPHLDDGWIINVWTDRDGQATLYIMVHESDPRWSEDLDELWVSWAMFQEVHAGKPDVENGDMGLSESGGWMKIVDDFPSNPPKEEAPGLSLRKKLK